MYFCIFRILGNDFTMDFLVSFCLCLRETDAVLKYLKEQYGAKKIGVVGFSWGGMAVHHLMLTNPELQTGVSFYGSTECIYT